MALTPMVGALGVLCRRTKYYVNGDATSGFVATESSDRRGTPANNAWAITPYGVAFLARDGIFLTTFVGKDLEISAKIYPLFIGETVNSEDPINWTDINTSSMAYYKGKLYFFYGSGTNATPNRVLVYSFTTTEWVMYDHAMRSCFVEEDTDLLTGGGVDGAVYSLESSSASDAGSNIALDVETKDFTNGQPTLRKLFLYAKVDADTATVDLTVRVYIDGTLQHTATVNSSRGKTLIPLPEDAWGYAIRFRFTYTGTAAIKIYGLSYEYIPLASS
jgi:hypothetical protein